MNIGKSPAIRNIGNKFGVEFAYITNMIAAETEQSSHSVRKNPGMPMMSEPYDMVRLSMLPGVGPNRGRTLANAFSGFDELRRTSVAAVLRLGVFTRQFAGALVSSLRDEGFQEKLESGIARCRARAAELGAGLLPWYHEDYPEPLRYIYDAPLYLFRTGSWQPADASGIAVVGTRAPSEYGRSVAAHISRELAERGVTTVSGLAFGIDTIVHESTIGNNGRTIAVLGSGLGRVYPTANRSLAERIKERGCLFSELPLDASPDAQNFPRRNRIISGLTLGTVVVESGRKGGAMITAKLALDQNREVFAVPGGIFSLASQGTNMLLAKGIAHAFTCVDDLFEQLPRLMKPATATRRPARQMSIEEQRLLDALSDSPIHIDSIAASLARGTHELLVQLLQLEFDGLVRQHPGKHFTRTG